MTNRIFLKDGPLKEGPLVKQPLYPVGASIPAWQTVHSLSLSAGPSSLVLHMVQCSSVCRAITSSFRHTVQGPSICQVQTPDGPVPPASLGQTLLLPRLTTTLPQAGRHSVGQSFTRVFNLSASYSPAQTDRHIDSQPTS